MTDDFSGAARPSAGLRRLLGGGGAVAIALLGTLLVLAGYVEWPLVALLSVGAALAGFFSEVEGVVRTLLSTVLEGSRGITIPEEAEFLERRLSSDPPPDKEPLWGIRLAEIYRKYLEDPARADALLDALLVKYPDSRELRVARFGAGPKP